MIRCNLTYSKNGVPVGFNTNLNSLEQTASGVWYAATSVKYGTSDAAGHGDAVGSLLDKISNSNMLYVGWVPNRMNTDDPQNPYLQTIPILNGPAKLNTIGLDVPYIKMWNFPHLGYRSADFGVQAGVPYVLGFVMEVQPYGDYEAFYPGPAYFGMANYNVRAGLSSYEIAGTTIPTFKRIYIQIEYKETEINVYHDGVLKGTHSNDLSLTHSDQRINNSLFVDTNNSCWNFFASYEWRGDAYNALMANKANIDASIVSKFKCGQVNPKPHAVTLTANYSGGVWTAVMTAANASEEQVEDAVYMWLVKGESNRGSGTIGAFNNQTEMLSTTSTLNESEYLSLDEGDRIELTPYVSIGGWDFIKGETKDIL